MAGNPDFDWQSWRAPAAFAVAAAVAIGFTWAPFTPANSILVTLPALRALVLLAAIVALRRTSDQTIRSGLALIACALGTGLLGEVYISTAILADWSTPIEGPSAVAYLLSYCLAIPGLVLLGSARSTLDRRVALTDIAMLGFASLVFNILISNSVAPAGQPFGTSEFVNAAYPTVSLLMAIALLAFVTPAGRRTVAFRLLAAAVTIEVFGELLLAAGVGAGGIYPQAGWWNAFTLVFLGLSGCGLLHPSLAADAEGRNRAATERGRFEFAFLAAAITAATLIVVAQGGVSGEPGPLRIAWACFCLAFIGRMFILLRRVDRAETRLRTASARIAELTDALRLDGLERVVDGDEALALNGYASGTTRDADDLQRDLEALLAAQLGAVRAERSRIGAELHDDVGQNLTGLLLHLRALEASGERRERIAALTNRVELTIESVRSLARELKSPGSSTDLAAILEWLAVDMTTAAGIELDLAIDPTVAVAEEDHLHVHRIAQEALSNVVRHSSCSRVRVELAPTDGGYRLAIVDDGTWIRGRPSGTGIANMGERARSLHGTLEVATPDGGGTSVILKVPHSR